MLSRRPLFFRGHQFGRPNRFLTTWNGNQGADQTVQAMEEGILAGNRLAVARAITLGAVFFFFFPLQPIYVYFRIHTCS